MKLLKLLLIGTLFLALGCQEGYVDDISLVAPGADETAPSVTIKYPGEGTLVRVREEVTPINIEFEVTDDIEVASITILLDGTKISDFTDFKDYRKVLDEYTYGTLTNGQHTLMITATDKSGKSTSGSVDFEKIAPYQPQYDGEIFYMPFDGDYLELVSITEATKVGNPAFADGGVSGKSYAGLENAYLTIPTIGLTNNEFSAAFWYKVNASPDRSGILVIGPPDTSKPTTPNNRNNGFRFFREGGATNQTFKLNVGNGASDNWFDGGAEATINPTVVTDWIHLAFTISESNVAVYINGAVVSQGTFGGVDWTGCDVLSIASGSPRFTEWGHLSDQSYIDELRIFNKALSLSEVQTLMADGNN